jgi:hypothetical protein
MALSLYCFIFADAIPSLPYEFCIMSEVLFVDLVVDLLFWALWPVPELSSSSRSSNLAITFYLLPVNDSSISIDFSLISGDWLMCSNSLS